MFNKVYDRIKAFFKENYKIIIVFIIMFLVLTLEFPYYINTPGGLINVDNRIEIDGEYKSKGSLNLAYVSEIKATIPTLLYSFINKDWDIIKESDMAYDNETYNDLQYRNHILLDESINNAIIVGYKYANKEIKISNEHFFIIYIDSSAKTDLKIGDEIISIDNNLIINKSEMNSIVASKNVSDKLLLKVKRDNKEIDCYGIVQEINGQKIVGVGLSKTSDLDTNPKIKFNFKNSESGPSGGFMTSLSIYNALIDEDITKGHVIVGTGTIDVNGNIGEIGGIEYKIKGAAKKHADIFLVPSGNNYIDAKKIVEENKYNIDLIEVTTFEDALNKLKRI